MEAAIAEGLRSMRLPTPDVADWFHKTIGAAYGEITQRERRQSTSLSKRLSELNTRQDRLLNAYLAGTVEEWRLEPG